MTYRKEYEAATYWLGKTNYFFNRERKRIKWHIKRAQKIKDSEEEKYWLKVLHYLELDESKIIL